MRIAFIEPSINNIYLNQVKSLTAYKDVEIYYISKDAGKVRIKGIHFIEPKCINILTRIIHFPTYAFLRFVSEKHKKYYLEFPESHYYLRLSKILRRIKPDVIISNLYYRPYTWQAGFFARRNKIPFILQTEIKRLPRNTLDRILTKVSLKLLKPLLFDNARYILPWTSEAEDFAKRNFKNIKLMPPCINTKLFRPMKKKKSKKLRILMVGRFVACKGYKDLIEALTLIKIPYQLNILGSGELEKEIRMLIKNNNVTANFLERVSYDEMPKIYNQNDVLILPSYNEAIGMVVPEAMACGLPVIVSDMVGAKMYVKTGTGYVFKTFNVRELADKIELISKRYKEMGEKAYRHIQNNFSCEILSEKFYRLLKSL